MPEKMTYEEAVKKAHQLLTELKIEPDQRMRELLTKWPPAFSGKGDGTIKYTADIDLSESVNLRVMVSRAHLDTGAGGS